MAKKNISKKDVVCEYVFIAVAMLIISASIYFFLIPSKVVIGSISGLAMVLSELTGFSISMLTMALNVVLLVIGFLLVGKEFGVKTVYTSMLLPVFLRIFEVICPLSGSVTGNNVYDVFAYILVAGFGQAILFNINASSGGIDIVAKIISKYTRMEIGKAVTLAGMVTAMSSIFVYGPGCLVVSMLATYANGQVIDYFIGGINKKKRICILSKNYEEIQNFILNEMGRGITLYTAKGAFQQEEQTELVTIMTVNEYKTLMNYLHESDFKVFVTISTVNEVIGMWDPKK